MSQISAGPFMWWAPWSVTRPWLPHAWRGADEWCNPAVSIVVPFLGAFHLFWQGQRRLMPCRDCWEQMDAEQQADYLDGGYLEGGRTHPDRLMA